MARPSNIVVVVLEIDRQGKETERQKLRIHADASCPAGIFLAQHLKEELLKGLKVSMCADKMFLQVFDPNSNEYLDLDNIKEGIVQRFGRRIRARAMLNDDQKEDPLAISGRFFDFDGRIQVGGYSLSIAEEPNLPDAGTAGNVWDGAILLARALVEGLVRFDDETSVILELGAGCGLAGVATAVAASASQLTLTDLPEALPRLQRNVAANRIALDAAGVAEVSCLSCDWFNPPSLQHLLRTKTNEDTLVEADVIVVADCVWMEDLVAPLFATLRQYVRSGDTQVLFCYQRRGKKTDDAFWKSLHNLFGSVESLSSSCTLQIPSVFHLLVCRR